MAKHALYEIFDLLDKVPDKEGRIASLKTIPDSVKTVLKYWLHPDIKFNIPEGEPPFESHNAVNTHNAFWSEIRRLPIFIVGGGYDHLTNGKRESLFISMLEYIHPKDARLVLNMKDKIWPYETLTVDDIKEAFPGLLE